MNPEPVRGVNMQLVLLLFSVLAVAVCSPPGSPGPPAPLTSADQLPMEARDSETILDDSEESLNPLQPYQPPSLLNGGKPFFLEKDPLTGALDFSATKTAPASPPEQDAGDGVMDYTYEEHDGIDRKDTVGTSGRPNDLGGAFKIVTPNFHDFLNLPVKYSSSGDKYPLISSSYANTKVQGMGGVTQQTHNGGGIKNHKPYPSSSSTQAPHYYTIPSEPRTSSSSTSTTTTTTALPPTTAPTTTAAASTTTTTSSSTTTTTTTARTTITTAKPKPSSFWGLLSGSDEYVDQPPDEGFGMRPPPKVPASSEERPVDYEYSYEDGEPSGPSAESASSVSRPQLPVNSHQPQPVPSTSSSTSTTTTTTTTTPKPIVRPTTRRPQLSTVKILKPFNRTPVVVTSRPAGLSTATVRPLITSTAVIPSTEATTPVATKVTKSPISEKKQPTKSSQTPSTSTLPITPIHPTTSTVTTNVVLVPEKSTPAVPAPTPSAPNKVVFEAPQYARPPMNRDSPYGVAANQPFRPLYDNIHPPYQQGLIRPPPPGPHPQFGGVPPSAFGDVITVPLPSDQNGADSNYVSFSFQPPSPQQMRPSLIPVSRPSPPRFPGVEPPRPNPPAPFHQPPPPPPPPPKTRPPPPVREEPELLQPPPAPASSAPVLVDRTSERPIPPGSYQGAQPGNSQDSQPSTPSSPDPTALTPGKVVFPDEKRDQITQDTKEIVVHGSFQHPSHQMSHHKPGMPPRTHHGQGPPPYRVTGQVLDGHLPPFRRPVPVQSEDLTPPYRAPDQVVDSNREGSEQQPAYQPAPGSPVLAQPATDLMPPADPGKVRSPHPVNDYPRPHWENTRPKPPGPPVGFQGMRPKVDSLGPPPYMLTHRPKPHGGPAPGHSGLGAPPMGPMLKMQGSPGAPQIGEPKPDPGLPNILPQFRPNARVSGGHGPIPQPIQRQRLPLMERPGAGRPHSILPAAPPGPHGIRINRNDDSSMLADVEIAGELEPAASVISSTLQRRSGPGSVHEPRRRVATLQMMKQHGAMPTHRVLTRAELPALSPYPVPPYQTGDKTAEHPGDRPPVFVVYPINAAAKRPGSPGLEDDGGVVMGSRGPSKPAPPGNMKLDSGDDILASMDGEPLSPPFAVHKQQRPLLNPSRDRGGSDGPILKPHRDSLHPNSLSKPAPSKVEFPYAIVQPESPNQSLSNSGDSFRHNSAVADKRKDDNTATDNHDDSEINVIPYLQDYMPFATKKPPSSPLVSQAKDDVSVGQDARIVVGSGTSAPPTNLQPISVTLRTVTPTAAVRPPAGAGPPSRHETVIGGASGGSEFTVGAVMHTLSNHRQSEGTGLGGPSPPEPDKEGFQAPFQASVSVESDPAPQREGWSVVNRNDASMKPGTVAKADIRDIIKENLPVTGVATSGSTDNSTFDFENFKPQLFGGFKPILPSEESDAASKENSTSIQPVVEERDRTLSEAS